MFEDLLKQLIVSRPEKPLDFLIQCSLTSQEVLGRYRQGGAETDESTELFFIPAETVRQERYRHALWHRSAL